MVVVRLARRGRKKNPFFHIVVTDNRMPRDGRIIEQLGYYNPVARKNDVQFQVKKDRADYWIRQGAVVSFRVRYLIRQFEKSLKKSQI
ncbi:30S ribosomal protein S16 [Coxiella endosymbiont of Amblyomma sculptum]|nr:30S ribosomal protein S16 [Coxiella endosymbiont of Amblyomma sculptum]QHG92713.1 30S ribosomal protein S16 [Coxiella endosymbiont of Amblyomma sculptum]